jgi:hypothetical protein
MSSALFSFLISRLTCASSGVSRNSHVSSRYGTLVRARRTFDQDFLGLVEKYKHALPRHVAHHANTGFPQCRGGMLLRRLGPACSGRGGLAGASALNTE